MRKIGNVELTDEMLDNIARDDYKLDDIYLYKEDGIVYLAAYLSSRIPCDVYVDIFLQHNTGNSLYTTNDFAICKIVDEFDIVKLEKYEYRWLQFIFKDLRTLDSRRYTYVCDESEYLNKYLNHIINFIRLK